MFRANTMRAYSQHLVAGPRRADLNQDDERTGDLLKSIFFQYLWLQCKV